MIGHRPLAGLALLAATSLLAVACGSSTPSGAPSPAPSDPPGQTASPAPSVPGGTPAQALATPAPSPSAIPLVVDTDLSSDDIMALAYLATEPAVDLRAVTVSGTGLVHPNAGAQNALAILAALGRRDIPVAPGSAEPVEGDRSFPAGWRDASDGAYGLRLDPAPVGPGNAVDLLRETIGSSPAPVTVLALGPMTNLAQTLAADPALASRIAGIHAMAGAIDVPGNVAADGGDPEATGAEWNLWVDPTAAAAVFSSGIPLTLVPLDATNDVPVTAGFVAELEKDHAAAGADVVYELLVRNGFLVGEGNYFWDQLATVLLVRPDLADAETASVRVEAAGADAGRLVRDPTGTPILYAVRPDVAGFERALLEGLRRGAPREAAFEIASRISVTFDGVRCDDGSPGTVPAGDSLVRFDAFGGDVLGLAIVRFTGDADWQTLLDHVATATDPSDQPAWVDLALFSTVEKSGSATSLVALTPGLHGIVCFRMVGDGVDTIPAGGPFTVEE